MWGGAGMSVRSDMTSGRNRHWEWRQDTGDAEDGKTTSNASRRSARASEAVFIFADIRDEPVNPDDSDYYSDLELWIEDQGVYKQIENDMHDDSDTEGTSERPASRRPSSQEIHFGAGRPLSDVNYTDLNLATPNHA